MGNPFGPLHFQIYGTTIGLRLTCWERQVSYNINNIKKEKKKERKPCGTRSGKCCYYFCRIWEDVDQHEEVHDYGNCMLLVSYIGIING